MGGWSCSRGSLLTSSSRFLTIVLLSSIARRSFFFHVFIELARRSTSSQPISNKVYIAFRLVADRIFSRVHINCISRGILSMNTIIIGAPSDVVSKPRASRHVALNLAIEILSHSWSCYSVVSLNWPHDFGWSPCCYHTLTLGVRPLRRTQCSLFLFLLLPLLLVLGRVLAVLPTRNAERRELVLVVGRKDHDLDRGE